MRIYGTVEDMMENFKLIDEIPEFIELSGSMDSVITFALTTRSIVYNESDGKPKYFSRSISAIDIFKYVINLVASHHLNHLADVYFRYWLTAFLCHTLRRLKGSYDLIPCSSQDPLVEDLKTFFKNKPEVTVPHGTITVEWFHDLTKYFEQEEQRYVSLIDRLKPDIIPSSQDFCKKGYAEIVYLIENTKKIFDRHIKLFTPSKGLTVDQKAAVRLLKTTSYNFLFAQEVNVAIKLLMNNRALNSQFSEDLIMVESEEERTNGIVYGMKPSKFEEILEKLGLCQDDFVILEVFCYDDLRALTLPIISSYGTHCMPAKDAFDRIIYYLAVVLKVFQRSNPENLKNVFKWIDDVMDPIFVENPVFYLVDVRKIDKIIDRARRELSQYLTEPEYEVPLKETYEMYDIYQELANLSENCIDKEWFLPNVENVLDWMPRVTNNVEMVFYGYHQIIRNYLRFKSSKIRSFRDKQLDIEYKLGFLEKPEEEPENEESKKGLLNENAVPPKKNESDQKEEVQQPSCSTENNENPAQQVAELLKKLRINENAASPRQQESHQTEEVQKPSYSTENDENREQQFAELLKEIRIKKKELEDELKRKGEDSEQEVDSVNEKMNAKYAKFQKKVKEHSEALKNPFSDWIGRGFYPKPRVLKKAKPDCLKPNVPNPEEEFETLEEE